MHVPQRSEMLRELFLRRWKIDRSKNFSIYGRSTPGNLPTPLDHKWQSKTHRTCMQPENQSELRQKFLLKRENVNAAIGSYLMCLCACLLQVIATDTLYQPLPFGQFLQKGWWPSCARLECNMISVSILCSNAISWMITIWKMVCDYPNAGSRLLNSRHRKLRRQGEKIVSAAKFVGATVFPGDELTQSAMTPDMRWRALEHQSLSSAYAVAYINGMRTETASTLRRTLFSCPPDSWCSAAWIDIHKIWLSLLSTDWPER